MADKMPTFKPQETTKANYDQQVINWSYVTLKYDTPFGPDQMKYDPYYSYNIDVNVGGQQIAHKWYPSVDEHESIQLTGATKGTVLAATYVKEDKRRGLVVMYSGGPQVVRAPEEVQAEIEAGLNALASKAAPGAAGTGMPGTLLPPAPPQIPPPPGAPTPPPPPQATAQAPTAPPPPAPPVPPQQPPPPRNSQPPRQPSTMNGESEGDYHPRKDNERVMEVIEAIADDLVYVRRMAWDKVEEAFADVLPVPPTWAKPNKAQQMEIAQIVAKRNDQILGISAPVNMGLDKQVYRVYKSGQSLAGEDTPEPESQPVSQSQPVSESERVPAKTKEEALTLINELHPDKYPDGHQKSAIVNWLKYTADPVKRIGTWKHAGNICNIFGLDTDVLLDDFDVTVLLQYSQAIWDYSDHRGLGESRNEVLEYIAEQYGIAPEQMQFEEEKVKASG